MLRKRLIFWIKLAAICCAVALCVNAAGTLLSGGDDIVRNASALPSLPRDSVDVFWLGTSHMHYNVIPQLLYDEYGITSTMVSGNSIDLTASYWQLRQALLTQSPQVIVLDVYPAAAPYCYFYVQNVLAMRSRENMPEGSNPHITSSALARWLPVGSPFKAAAIKDAYDVSYAEGENYFGITRFHSRYSELGRQHFRALEGSERLSHSFGYLYGDYTLDQSKVSIRPYSPEAAMEANEEGTYWTFTDEQLAEVQLMQQVTDELQRIIDFTKRKGIQLVLCAAPYQTNAAEELLFEQVGKLAEANGIAFVGLNDTPANDPAYFRDLGHLNDEGARIFTSFWGDWLTGHYDLADRRESTDARYAAWRERAGSHDLQTAGMQLSSFDGGLTGYLEELSSFDHDHMLLFTATGDVFDGFTEDDYWLLVDGLGVAEEELEDWYYTGCGTLDILLYDGEFIFSQYEPDGRDYDIVRNVQGYDVQFGTGRWRVNGVSAGNIETGMSISVYSLLDDRMLDYRTFDLMEMYFDE